MSWIAPPPETWQCKIADIYSIQWWAEVWPLQVKNSTKWVLVFLSLWEWHRQLFPHDNCKQSMTLSGFIFTKWAVSAINSAGCPISVCPHVSVATSQWPRGFPVRTLYSNMELFFTSSSYCFSVLLLHVPRSLLLIVESFSMSTQPLEQAHMMLSAKSLKREPSCCKATDVAAIKKQQQQKKTKFSVIVVPPWRFWTNKLLIYFQLIETMTFSNYKRKQKSTLCKVFVWMLVSKIYIKLPSYTAVWAMEALRRCS